MTDYEEMQLIDRLLSQSLTEPDKLILAEKLENEPDFRKKVNAEINLFQALGSEQPGVQVGVAENIDTDASWSSEVLHNTINNPQPAPNYAAHTPPFFRSIPWAYRHEDMALEPGPDGSRNTGQIIANMKKGWQSILVLTILFFAVICCVLLYFLFT